MEHAFLRAMLDSLEDHRKQVRVVVTAAAYACCGKGWQAREGYEQTYQGYIANIDLPGAETAGGARLIARGVGTVSYFAVFGFEHVVDVEAL